MATAIYSAAACQWLIFLVKAKRNAMKFNPLLPAMLTCVLLTLPASAQTAAPPVGYVKTVTGEAWVTSAGANMRAGPGTPVLLGSQLKTLAKSSLGVTFKDNTL